MLSLEHLVFRTSSRASTAIKKMKNWRQISELAFPKEEGEKEEERSRDKVEERDRNRTDPSYFQLTHELTCHLHGEKANRAPFLARC